MGKLEGSQRNIWELRVAVRGTPSLLPSHLQALDCSGARVPLCVPEVEAWTLLRNWAPTIRGRLMGRAQGLRNPALSGEASKYLKTGWGAGRNRVACECPKLASTQEGREEVGAGGGGRVSDISFPTRLLSPRPMPVP